MIMENLIIAKQQFNNTKLKRIINTYQLIYKDGNSPPGFGDYLKSCFFLLQLCKILNIEFDMNFRNHPISKYFIVDNQENLPNYSIIEYPEWGEHCYIDNNGLDNFIKNINNITSPNYYLFTNGWTNIKIRKQGINIIRSKLLPNNLLIEHIDKFMNSLHLTYKKFITIHIRCNDDAFNNNNNNTNVPQKIKNSIINISIANNCKCLILSNSVNVKKYIQKLNLNNICFKFSNCIHLGSGESINNNIDDGILDTLKDFFVMSKSKLIYSFSVYDWGSCFSDMCSQIYSIPIIKIKI